MLQRALLKLSGQQREILVLFHRTDWPISLTRSTWACEGTVKPPAPQRKRTPGCSTARRAAGADDDGPMAGAPKADTDRDASTEAEG